MSPLGVKNAQYGLQLVQNDLIGVGLDSSFLVPASPISDSTQHSFTPPSKPSLTRPRHDTVPPPPQLPALPITPDDPPVKVKRRRRRRPPPPPEVAAAKRKAFLERNREAASKCRKKKKDQINGLEAEERMARQINAVLKDEVKDIVGEAMRLREEIKDMKCDKDCEGCGTHAPMRKDSVFANPSIGAYSIGNNQNQCLASGMYI